MLGTKWPSMTSTCTQSHPALSIARTSSPSRAKSADRIDGAMRMSFVMRTPLLPLPMKNGERQSTLSSPARLGFARPGVALQELDHGARHIGAARLLHALDAG